MRTLLICLMCAACALHAAQADERIDVDVDVYGSEVYATPRGVELRVQYEVDVELDDKHGRLPPLVLRLLPMDDDFLFEDADGNVLEVVLPLDRPRRVDDEEFTFKGRVIIPLPDGFDPHQLKVEGAVFVEGQERSLDDDSTSARCRLHWHHRGGWGVHVDVWRH